MDLNDLVELTWDITDDDLNEKRIMDLYASLAEEVGELATAILAELNIKGKKEDLDEPASHEAIDVIICGLAMYRATKLDANLDDLRDIMHKKLMKWKNSKQ